MRARRPAGSRKPTSPFSSLTSSSIVFRPGIARYSSSLPGSRRAPSSRGRRAPRPASASAARLFAFSLGCGLVGGLRSAPRRGSPSRRARRARRRRAGPRAQPSGLRGACAPAHAAAEALVASTGRLGGTLWKTLRLGHSRQTRIGLGGHCGQPHAPAGQAAQPAIRPGGRNRAPRRSRRRRSGRPSPRTSRVDESGLRTAVGRTRRCCRDDRPRPGQGEDRLDEDGGADQEAKVTTNERARRVTRRRAARLGSCSSGITGSTRARSGRRRPRRTAQRRSQGATMGVVQSTAPPHRALADRRSRSSRSSGARPSLIPDVIGEPEADEERGKRSSPPGSAAAPQGAADHRPPGAPTAIASPSRLERRPQSSSYAAARCRAI